MQSFKRNKHFWNYFLEKLRKKKKVFLDKTDIINGVLKVAWLLKNEEHFQYPRVKEKKFEGCSIFGLRIITKENVVKLPPSLLIAYAE